MNTPLFNFNFQLQLLRLDGVSKNVIYYFQVS